MSDFSAEWLALREPADWRARSPLVTRAVARALPTDRTIHAVDLAAGTGSNARFLAAALPSPQDWLLVDHSEALLAQAQRHGDLRVRTRAANLAQVDALESLFEACDLVTASALLDLVSDAWLRTICATCRRHRVAVLFALSYDGRIECSPAEPDDEVIRNLVNRHQRTDKGFGPALGPDAAAQAIGHLEALGYQVVRDRSDWVIDPDSAALQGELIDGWASAAAEIAPGEAARIEGWRRRRVGHVDAQRLRLVVGHEDVGAFIA